MIPGMNLLGMASRLIAMQSVQYRIYTGATENAAGILVPTWAAAISVSGSLQPIDHRLLQQYGLDVTKRYMTFYTMQAMGEPERDRTGDRITYGGRTYQVESKTPWNLQDGWGRAICVEVSNA